MAKQKPLKQKREAETQTGEAETRVVQYAIFMETRHGHDSEGEHELRMQRVAAEPEENEEHGLITGAPNLASKALSAPRIRQAASVAGACLIYLTIGPTLIIVNRTLLVARKFDYPMTVASLGVLCSTVVSFVLVHCRCVRREHTNLITPKFFVYNLLPIGASLATTLACGNWVHLYLPVGFIQMLKATTPMVTLAMLWVSGIETPTLRVTLSVLGIVLGTCIASLGASLGGNFSVVGLGLMLLAELSEALKLVLIQKMLTNLKFGVSKCWALLGRAPPFPTPPLTHACDHPVLPGSVDAPSGTGRGGLPTAPLRSRRDGGALDELRAVASARHRYGSHRNSTAAPAHHCTHQPLAVPARRSSRGSTTWRPSRRYGSAPPRCSWSCPRRRCPPTGRTPSRSFTASRSSS